MPLGSVSCVAVAQADNKKTIDDISIILFINPSVDNQHINQEYIQRYSHEGVLISMATKCRSETN